MKHDVYIQPVIRGATRAALTGILAIMVSCKGVSDKTISDDRLTFHHTASISAPVASNAPDDDRPTSRRALQPTINLRIADTDGDGFHAEYETFHGTNPCSAASSPLILASNHVADARVIIRQYLDLRAQNAALDRREAVWNQLMRSSRLVKNELHDMENGSASLLTLGQIENLKDHFDGAIREALTMPSTAQLQWRWLEASFDGIRRLTVTQEWEWKGANAETDHWTSVGPLRYHAMYLRHSGSWSDSDGNGGPTATLEEAMDATSKPKKFHDTSEDNLGATGSWMTGTTSGNTLPPAPDKPGTLHGQRCITTATSWTPETYIKQFREFRISRSADGDTGVPLSMHFLKSSITETATPAHKGVTLQPAKSLDESPNSMKRDGGVRSAPQKHP